MESFNILSIMNAATNAAAGLTAAEGYKDVTLDIFDIEVTTHNKYSMEEIQELAAGIEMAGGLQQPLVIGKFDGKNNLCSGHRRLEALKLLVEDGKEEFKLAPCKSKPMSELEFKFNLLIGNTFNRKLTDYDKMIQAQEWKKLLKEAKESGQFKPEKGRRTRDYITALMGEKSSATVGELERINNNATEEIKEQFAAGNINKTAAAVASTLPDEQQNKIAQRAATGEEIRAEEIKELARQQRESENSKKTAHGFTQSAEIDENDADGEKPDKATLKQIQPFVSDTDTKNDEKENARRLHVLKMLEKYYAFLSDYETRQLEKMLEDCKRRKREYAIEDVGSTI